MDVNGIIEYWKKSAEEDYKTAQGLFTLGRYAPSLFYCHLTIEKILKGLVVKQTSEQAPHEHNLTVLSSLTGIDFSREQLDLFDEINSFNIKARYDDFKFEFYKKATRFYAEKYLNEVTQIFLWLKKHLTK